MLYLTYLEELTVLKKPVRLHAVHDFRLDSEGSLKLLGLSRLVLPILLLGQGAAQVDPIGSLVLEIVISRS